MPLVLEEGKGPLRPREQPRRGKLRFSIAAPNEQEARIAMQLSDLGVYER